MIRCIAVLCALTVTIAFIKAEEGAECIYRCVAGGPGSRNATSRQDRSASYMALAKRSAEVVQARGCSNFPLGKCVRACPRSRLDAIVRSLNDVIAKHCDDQEATVYLANGMDALRKKWIPMVDSCVDNMTVTDMDGLCKQSVACIFETLEALRSEFSDEARTAGSGFFLLGFDTGIMRGYGSNLPPTCDPLFDTDQRYKLAAKSPEQDTSFEAKFRKFLRTYEHSR
ncbi:hypothetical protein AAVH_29754 [Aphelenchoides avenae]|nr:hypothetical protein AAVH_29754 [Aphelenchus avenae]